LLTTSIGIVLVTV